MDDKTKIINVLENMMQQLMAGMVIDIEAEADNIIETLKLAAVREERDRYREALEKIDNDATVFAEQDKCECALYFSGLARAALEAK